MLYCAGMWSGAHPNLDLPFHSFVHSRRLILLRTQCSLWPKRVSFATKESLFLAKVGKMTFSARTSLLYRYFALSLHSETDERWLISFSSSQSAFALPSLWVRSAFASGSESRGEKRGREEERRKSWELRIENWELRIEIYPGAAANFWSKK